MEHEDACCPFLNNSDVRCNRHFRLDQMQLAFKHCFGNYLACPIAAQILGTEPAQLDSEESDDADLALHLPVLTRFQQALSSR